MDIGLGIAIASAVLGLIILGASVKIVGQAEVLVVERLGRFHRLARSGLNLLIPFVERPRAIDVRLFELDRGGAKRVTASSTSRIDLREQVLNFPSQPVITKDNVTIDIDAVLYYRIADPQKATYAVQNLPYALIKLACGESVPAFTKYDVGTIFVRHSWDMITRINEFEKLAVTGER